MIRQLIYFSQLFLLINYQIKQQFSNIHTELVLHIKLNITSISIFLQILKLFQGYNQLAVIIFKMNLGLSKIKLTPIVNKKTVSERKGPLEFRVRQSQLTGTVSRTQNSLQNQLKIVNDLRISKLIETRNRNIYQAKQELQELQKELEQTESKCYKALQKNIQLEMQEEKWKKQEIVKYEEQRKIKLLKLEEQRKIKLLKLEEQRKIKLLSLEEQRQKMEKKIQECDTKIFMLKQQREVYEINLEQINGSTLKQENINEIKIRNLKYKIQRISSSIDKKEIQRIQNQKKYDKCSASIDAITNDQEIQPNPLYNSVVIDLNEENQLLSTINQNRELPNSPYHPLIILKKEEIKNHLNKHQELKQKIAKLQKEIDQHKRAAKEDQQSEQYKQMPNQ